MTRRRRALDAQPPDARAALHRGRISPFPVRAKSTCLPLRARHGWKISPDFVNGLETAQLPASVLPLEALQAATTDCCSVVFCPETGAPCTSPPITAKAIIASTAIIIAPTPPPNVIHRSTAGAPRWAARRGMWLTHVNAG